MSQPQTVFEKIITKILPAKIEYEDDDCIVFHDIHPQAPVHLLIVPKKMIARVSALEIADKALLGHLIYIAKILADKLDLGDGFRLVINNGLQAGETVPHLHIHLLSGRPMLWPPG